MLKKAYENAKKNRDKLAEAETLIDWEAFRPIITPHVLQQKPKRRKAERGRGGDSEDAWKGVKKEAVRLLGGWFPGMCFIGGGGLWLGREPFYVSFN